MGLLRRTLLQSAVATLSRISASLDRSACWPGRSGDVRCCAFGGRAYSWRRPARLGGHNRHTLRSTGWDPGAGRVLARLRGKYLVWRRRTTGDADRRRGTAEPRDQRWPRRSWDHRAIREPGSHTHARHTCRPWRLHRYRDRKMGPGGARRRRSRGLRMGRAGS